MKPHDHEINIKGKKSRVDLIKIENKNIIITGKFFKTARLEDEWDVELDNPLLAASEIENSSNIDVDLFTFVQRIPETQQKYYLPMIREGIAAIPVVSYEKWYGHLKKETRKCITKARKMGVVVRNAELNDDFIKGIKGIYDETPIRQGKPFWHYKKDLDTLRKDHQTFIERSDFIGAYYNDVLIGFIKLLNTDRYAWMMQIISKIEHRDKSPTNALIAKAVELCEQKKSGFLTYGVSSKGGLGNFKKNNGFVDFMLPRYFIPMTLKGNILAKYILNNGFSQFLPVNVMDKLALLRAKYYSTRHKYYGK